VGAGRRDVKLRFQLGVRLVVAAMLMVYLTCAFLIQLFNVRSGHFAEDLAGSFALLLAFSAYMARGVMILLRRPGHAMGWIPSSIGLLVDRFASRIREEVDLKGLTTDLTGVGGRTLHPASLSLWLREDT
jgi:hypothetical protein